MPRRARLVVPGIPWHIIQRGNNRMACFYEKCDYQYFLKTLAEQAAKYQCCLHAWCLMTNHVLCGAPHNRCNVKFRIM